MSTLTKQEMIDVALSATDIEGDVRVISAYKGRDGCIAFRIPNGEAIRLGVALASVLGTERATALAQVGLLDHDGQYQRVFFHGWALAQ